MKRAIFLSFGYMTTVLSSVTVGAGELGAIFGVAFGVYLLRVGLSLKGDK